MARALLRVVVRRELLDEVAGDLEQDFHAKLKDQGRGPARRAYWKEVLSPSLLGLRRETAGVAPARGARMSARTGEGTLGHLAQDLRYALRVLGKAPGFAAVAILSIALGVGPNTAIFSAINGIVFAQKGIPEPGRAVQIYGLDREGGYTAVGRPTYDLIEEGTRDVFSGVMAYTNLTGHLGREDRRAIVMELVTGNYFDVLGVEAAMGRWFLPEEDAAPGTHQVVVISHRLWQDLFGGSPGAVGSEIILNGRPYTVVGVAPASYRGRFPGIATTAWVPYMTYPHLRPNQPRSGNLWMVGRVADGVPTERSVSAVAAFAAGVDQERQSSGRTSVRFRLEAWALDQFWVQPDLDRPVVALAGLLSAAVGLVLLISCTNLAGFLLARAQDRRKEMSVRIALGASRRAIVRQLLVEALVLAVAGGAIGLGLGALLIRGILALEPPIGTPLDLDIGLDGRVLAFTALLTLVAAGVFGLVPSLRAAGGSVGSTLRDESAGAGQSRSKHRVRNLLVGGQMALSLVLLVGAGLFLRSLQAAGRIDPGFDTGPAGIVSVNAVAAGYQREAWGELNERIMREVEALPGVEAVAATNRLPLELGTYVRFLDIPGVAPPEGADHHRLEHAIVSPGYFETMGIEIARGRAFGPEDTPDAPLAVLLSREAAERFWPGEDPLGKVMTRAGDASVEYHVIGVTDDVKIWTLTEPDRPYMYSSAIQEPDGYLNYVVRGELPAPELVRSLRGAIASVDPTLYLTSAKTLDEHLGFVLYLPRMGAILLAGFGALALTLASIGLYGLVSYGVARRTREVGIRMALGARRRAVMLLAVRGGLSLVVTGAGLGLVLAVLLAPLMKSLLIRVSWLDPLTFLTVPLLLGTVAAVAAYLPARRATRVDPVEALRAD